MMPISHVAVVGAGISGATVARAFADADVRSTVYEAGTVVGGMCREISWEGELVSEFGPHIFRTASDDMWRFINRFADLVECRHHVVTSVGGKAVPFPPLTTTPPSAQGFTSVGAFLLAAVGEQIFRTFYEEYTWKRWGVSAFELSPSMIPLVPVQRHPTGFFVEGHVGIPVRGFTALVERMLDHPMIEVCLDKRVACNEVADEAIVIWTARLDELSPPTTSELGLPYRSVRQEFERKTVTDENVPVVTNFPQLRDPQIRRTDYSALLPWRPRIIGTEYAEESGPPAYPVLTHASEARAEAMLGRAMLDRPNVVAHGRLGRFQYISMDRAISSSLTLVQKLLRDHG